MTTETGGCSPAQKKTATESEIRVRTGAVITLTGILVLYFSRYAYVLEAAAAMLSIMGIVELLRAAKCCTWYNVLLLSLIAAAVCMRRLVIHKVFLRKNGFSRRKIPRCWSYFRFSDRP